MATINHQTDSDQQARSEMQRRHGSKRKLERVASPEIWPTFIVDGMKDIYEAVRFRHETGWGAAICCQYSERKKVVGCDCTTDLLILRAREIPAQFNYILDHNRGEELLTYTRTRGTKSQHRYVLSRKHTWFSEPTSSIVSTQSAESVARTQVRAISQCSRLAQHFSLMYFRWQLSAPGCWKYTLRSRHVVVGMASMSKPSK